MDTIAGLPFFPLEITKDGQLFSQQQKTAIENAASQAGADKVTDFFVISHGWNNDMAEARSLYAGLFKNVVALIPKHASLANRKFAIVRSNPFKVDGWHHRIERNVLGIDLYCSK